MIVYDLADVQELTGFVRSLPETGPSLADYLPTVTVDDVEYRFTTGQFDLPEAAAYRAFDTEAQIGTRAGAARVRGELPPISRKMRLGEEQRLRLRSLQSAATGTTAAIVDAIFDDAVSLAASIGARVELARAQLLTEFQVTLDENGVQAEVSFPYSPDQIVSATDNGGLLWSDPDADVVGQWSDWSVAATNRGGVKPAVALMSTQTRSHLLRNRSVATAAATVAGAPTRVGLATLGAVLGDQDLQEIVTYDRQVRVGGAPRNVLPTGVVVFLPPSTSPVGATFSGITAEAIELVEARQLPAGLAPGLVAVVDKTWDPVATWTKVSGVTIPALQAPERITVAQVL